MIQLITAFGGFVSLLIVVAICAYIEGKRSAIKEQLEKLVKLHMGKP